MGVFRRIVRLVRTVATGGRATAEVIEDGSNALRIIKAQILRALARLFRRATFYIAIISLLVLVAVAAVALVFEMFSMSFYGDDQAMTELNIDDMKIWSDSLSDEEIEGMQEYGANVHPVKVYEYALIEDESYPKNVEILVPTHIKKWGDGGTSNETIYKDYLYKRGDASYPYRQWWQSIATIDLIKDTANDKKDMKIVDKAKEELKPSFIWTDPETDTYIDGTKYAETSDKQLEYIKTTTVKVVTSGDGSSSTKTNYTEERTYKPLPFLEMATTMFENVSFEYKEVNEILEPIVKTNSRTYTKTKTKTRVNEAGEIEKYEDKVSYTETTTVTTVREINTWEPIGELAEFQDTYASFLNDNRIDTRSDPYMMFLMAESMPQSYDFLNGFGEYLSYMDVNTDALGVGGPSGSYTGDFGEFEGGMFGWPVPSHHYITSHYGYRTNPFNPRGKKVFHQGVDLRAPLGVDIVAAGDGIVSFTGNRGSYGKLVILNHGSGIETYYAHNSRISVSPGQKVSRGQLVAKAGSTGNSTASHLHFEVRKNNKYVDPLPWLKR